MKQQRCSFCRSRALAIRRSATGAVLTALALVTLTALTAKADGSNSPPFDFSDAFYLQNGINPAAILNRVGTFDAAGNPIRPLDWTFDESNTDPNLQHVRLLQTTGGFNNSGSLIYYSIMGMVTPQTFTSDAAGDRARQIANSFRAFLFPKCLPNSTPNSVFVRDGCSVLLSPALGNRRQDNVFDTRNGYFSNDPLGLWILAFVVFTPQAFTPEGQAELAPIAATNGTDLEGTPILTTASGIDGLVSKGLVQILTRAQDGSQGFPWVI